MDLERGDFPPPEITDPETGDPGPDLLPATARRPESGQVPSIPPEESTALLRRCTALATKARADLLNRSRPGDPREFQEVLSTLAGWPVDSLRNPDPTMVVLASASLHDLADRLPVETHGALGAQVDSALSLLEQLMRPADVRPAG